MSVRPIVPGQPCFWQRGSRETSAGDAECLGAQMASDFVNLDLDTS